jgi:hypothetical protein
MPVPPSLTRDVAHHHSHVSKQFLPTGEEIKLQRNALSIVELGPPVRCITCPAP